MAIDALNKGSPPQDASQPPIKIPDPVSASELYFDLGTYSRPVESRSQDARIWFNRGLLWFYGFNLEAARECFLQTLSHDRDCIAAYFGLALASGPHYNEPWKCFGTDQLHESVDQCRWAVEQGRKQKTRECLESALLEAVSLRLPPKGAGEEELASANDAYADAMIKVYTQYGSSDPDVCALTADALMNLRPWDLWDIHRALPNPAAPVAKIRQVLQDALSNPDWASHPGLLHLWIHFIEMSPHPEEALPHANRLRGLSPDGGHLNHMPSHIYLLVGNYVNAIAANQEAILGDERYRKRYGNLTSYTFYRIHNYHLLIYAAMLSGRFRDAMEAIEGIETTLDHETFDGVPATTADQLEYFLSVRIHVLVRFGKWKELLQLELPTNQKHYCVMTATIHYGKGIAYAALNMVSDAQKEQALYLRAYAQIPDTRMMPPSNRCVDILKVGTAMLDGEIAYRQGRYSACYESLRSAVQLSDALHYDEPWPWMMPPRHALGALLLEQENVAEAKEVFEADLGLDSTLPRACQHPKNIWALEGYRQCLRKLGMEAEALRIDEEAKAAIDAADTSIEKPCFCAQ